MQSAVQMKWFCYLLASVIMLLVSSCIDGDEEVWINKDGSARMRAEYRVPATAVSQGEAEQIMGSIRKAIEKDPGMELVEYSATKSKGKRVIVVELTTTNLMKLKNMVPKEGKGGKPAELTEEQRVMLHVIGKISVQVEGMDIEMRRKVKLAPLLEKYVGKKSSIPYKTSQFRYILHLPFPVESSSATETLDNGRTLIWESRLSDYREEPLVMEFKARVPLPWWVYVAGVGIVLILVFFLFLIFRRLKRRKKA